MAQVQWSSDSKEPLLTWRVLPPSVQVRQLLLQGVDAIFRMTSAQFGSHRTTVAQRATIRHRRGEVMSKLPLAPWHLEAANAKYRLSNSVFRHWMSGKPVVLLRCRP